MRDTNDYIKYDVACSSSVGTTPTQCRGTFNKRGNVFQNYQNF